MKDVNKIMLLGRLGADPVRRQTKNGLAVTHFSLATSRKLIDQEGGAEAKEREETQWHKVVVWGRQAEVCKAYLAKGQAVYLEGMIRARKYTGKDGASRTAFEVHAESVSFLGRKRTAAGTDPTESSGASFASDGATDTQDFANAPSEMAMSA